MKRLHVHLAVDDLDQSIAFYGALFNQDPSVHKADYAKWMLDDPKVNFSISARGKSTGIDHLGIQVDEIAELADLSARLEAAGNKVLEQTNASCCYAVSDKAWVRDPSGVRWETFHTTGEIPVFGEDTFSKQSAETERCCNTPA